ncbi:MAG TPA: methyltransferase domain-containing protein [Dehalococcoidia bacterium]|nr:methyltransferase domain-containing protein [Dehalococcoidia bacterium]
MSTPQLLSRWCGSSANASLSQTGGVDSMRDPVQYARFSDERSRPFYNLLERVPQGDFRRIVDLGCGSGELTRALAERWPQARVVGLDSSPQMLDKAWQHQIPGRLDFRLGDVNEYAEPADLLFSNATLQWLDDHPRLFPRLAGLLNPGGVLAVQMPFSHVQRSHELLEETVRSGPWAAKLQEWHRFRVQPLTWYVELMLGLGYEVDAWETTYYFVLQGEDPVLEWVKGTSLQPILGLLDEAERKQFLTQYAAVLREAYPPAGRGTVYPFRRIFFVARRP